MVSCWFGLLELINFENDIIARQCTWNLTFFRFLFHGRPCYCMGMEPLQCISANTNVLLIVENFV